MAYKFVPYTAGGSGGGSATLTELSVTLNGVYEPTSEIKVGDTLRAKDRIIETDFPENIQAEMFGSGGEIILAKTDRFMAGVLSTPNMPGDFLLSISLDDAGVMYLSDGFMPMIGLSGPGGWYDANIEEPTPLSEAPEFTVVDESMSEAIKEVTYLFHVPDPPDGFSKVNVNVPASGSMQRYININNSMTNLFSSGNTNEYYKVTDEDVSAVLSGLDTSKVKSTRHMFSNCRALTAVPLFDTSSVTDMGRMFEECQKLKTVPSFDTRSVTSMSNMFHNCFALTSIPLMDTKALESAHMMFWGCNAEIIPALDFRNVTKADDAMACMSRVRDIQVKNIKASTTIGDYLAGTDGTIIEAWGTLLTVDCLVHIIYELRDTGSTKTLSMASYNIDKLASVYVRLIEVTDEMRSEDDLVDEKKPFEVCNSTDEGAMLITDYVLTKNWALA